MDLERLKLFVQVAELGSLSKVAGVTGVPQSAISRKITAFEDECSGRLFHRTGRGVTLTEFGTRVLPRITALLHDAEQLALELKTSAGVPSGPVRIGMMPSLSHPAVERLLRVVRERLPQVQLSLLEGSGGQLDEWLASGRVDLAVLFRYGASAPAGEEALALVDTYLIGRPGNPLTRQADIEFSQLANVPLVLPGVPNGLRVALARVAQQHHIQLKVVMEADSLPIQKNIAASGEAYAVLASHAARLEIEAGALQASCIVNPRIKRTIVLSTTSAHPCSLACREVTGVMRRIFQDMVADSTLKVEAIAAGQD